MKLQDEMIAATIAVKIRMERRQYRTKTAQEATRRMWLDIQRAKSWLNMCNQEGVKS